MNRWAGKFTHPGRPVKLGGRAGVGAGGQAVARRSHHQPSSARAAPPPAEKAEGGDRGDRREGREPVVHHAHLAHHLLEDVEADPERGAHHHAQSEARPPERPEHQHHRREQHRRGRERGHDPPPQGRIVVRRAQAVLAQVVHVGDDLGQGQPSRPRGEPVEPVRAGRQPPQDRRDPPRLHPAAPEAADVHVLEAPELGPALAPGGDAVVHGGREGGRTASPPGGRERPLVVELEHAHVAQLPVRQHLAEVQEPPPVAPPEPVSGPRPGLTGDCRGPPVVREPFGRRREPFPDHQPERDDERARLHCRAHDPGDRRSGRAHRGELRPPGEPPETEQSADEGGGGQQGVHPARHAHHHEREGRRVVERAAAHVVQIDDEVADGEQGDEPDEDDEDPPEDVSDDVALEDHAGARTRLRGGRRERRKRMAARAAKPAWIGHTPSAGGRSPDWIAWVAPITRPR